MPARRGSSRAGAKSKGKAHTARGRSASRGSGEKPGPEQAKRWGPRADKGEGEAAVQARIAALSEPSRSIMARLHPMIMKHGSELQPTVRYGFAIYMRGPAMALIAAPRKSYVSLGYPTNLGIRAEPIEFASPDEVDEAQVATMVKRVAD